MKYILLTLAAVSLPALAYADHDHDRDDHGRHHGWIDRDDRYRDRHSGFPTVPETSPGWVLLPVVGAILLTATLQRRKGGA